MLQRTGSSPKLETAPRRTTTASEGSGHEWRGRGATSSCRLGLHGQQSHPGLLLPAATLKRGAAMLKTATPALSTAGFSTPSIEKHNCQRSEITRSCSYRSAVSPPALGHAHPRSSSSPWPHALFSQRPWLEDKKRHGWPAQNLLAEDMRSRPQHWP